MVLLCTSLGKSDKVFVSLFWWELLKGKNRLNSSSQSKTATDDVLFKCDGAAR